MPKIYYRQDCHLFVLLPFSGCPECEHPSADWLRSDIRQRGSLHRCKRHDYRLSFQEGRALGQSCRPRESQEVYGKDPATSRIRLSVQTSHVFSFCGKLYSCVHG